MRPYTGWDFSQLAADPQSTKRQALGRYQSILIKQRNLGASKAHIYNRRSLLDDPVKFSCLCRHCLIADKTLL